MLQLKDVRGWFRITDENFIIRCDLPDFQPSGQWLFRGIVRRNNFGHIVESIWADDLRKMVAAGKYSMHGTPCDAADFYFFNNGKCRWAVCDIDHGTNREWGGHSGVEQFYI